MSFKGIFTSTYVRGDPVILKILGVTHLVDENLSLTQFRQFWQLVGRYCRRMVELSDPSKREVFTYVIDGSPCTAMSVKPMTFPAKPTCFDCIVHALTRRPTII